MVGSDREVALKKNKIKSSNDKKNKKKRRFVVDQTYKPPRELVKRTKMWKIELKKAMERKKEEKRKKKKARIVVVSEQTKPIGRIERGQRYQYYAIVYPVRKVVRTFESALEVVKGVTGQHWRGFNSEERALEYLCDWERIDTECLSFNREKRKTLDKNGKNRLRIPVRAEIVHEVRGSDSEGWIQILSV